MQKGQISLDFIIAGIIFMIVFSVFLSATKDFFYKGDNTNSYIQNYVANLKIKDIYFSTKDYNDFNVSYKLDFASKDCILATQKAGVFLGNKDYNFLLPFKQIIADKSKCKGFKFKIK